MSAIVMLPPDVLATTFPRTSRMRTPPPLVVPLDVPFDGLDADAASRCVHVDRTGHVRVGLTEPPDVLSRTAVFEGTLNLRCGCRGCRTTR